MGQAIQQDGLLRKFCLSLCLLKWFQVYQIFL
jgi:hypothetical protein